jgi:acetoin utilization deacetylase AcuC-like enzyme
MEHPGISSLERKLIDALHTRIEEEQAEKKNALIDQRTSQLLNELYHERSRLERKLKRVAEVWKPMLGNTSIEWDDDGPVSEEMIERVQGVLREIVHDYS